MVYLVLWFVVFRKEPLQLFIGFFTNLYISIVESIANNTLLSGRNVFIDGSRIIFGETGNYHDRYAGFINNWPSILLYKRWTIIVLLLILAIVPTFRQKLVYFSVFLAVHLMAVLGGIYFLAVAGPVFIGDDPGRFLVPTIPGTFLLYSFLAILLYEKKESVRKRIRQVGLRFQFSDSSLVEFLSVFFGFLVLKDIVLPLFHFSGYVKMLLLITKGIATLMGHDGIINGDQLNGANGSLALSKHCLGFLTFYLFLALVFLTRPRKNFRTPLFYAGVGFAILFILNIARLVAVFVIAQGEGGHSKASLHHEIYNVVLYSIVFILWVIWYEFFLKRERNASS